MHYLLSILAVLAIGMIVLIAGILIAKEPEQSLQNALNESLIWGVAFCLSFGTEASIFYVGLI